MRFWPAAIADALLGLVDGDKPLLLAEDACLKPFVPAGAGAAGGGDVGGERIPLFSLPLMEVLIWPDAVCQGEAVFNLRENVQGGSRASLRSPSW